MQRSLAFRLAEVKVLSVATIGRPVEERIVKNGNLVTVETGEDLSRTVTGAVNVEEMIPGLIDTVVKAHVTK